ncbi:QueT transporter family protein [Psychrobacillus glaciei]|uniref:QueT transporter family protein n=1 Tax=Psychrobacillus glaciei TaxID=2283160 RepID=A0A5J6SQK9_9BACI|nr:QueT transporter family protein [Psychrobacillus glaciei]QFG00246.1 QueT transporter family protein [Psychrobacillus glaciei]
MKTKTLATSGIIAALYVAVSLLVAPFGFTAVQFRISEMFNHLVVFNKKFFFGIVLGVFVTNIFSPMAAYDLIFGVAHSVISLSITIFASKFIKGHIPHMVFNTLIFTVMTFIIAFELQLAFDLPFFYTWLTVAAGEFAVLAVGIPVMTALNKRLNFKTLI